MSGQIFATGSLGGLFDGKNLTDELLKGNMATQKFRQYADIKNAWNTKRSGETFTWDLVPMMSRGDRTLAETSTIPQGNTTVLQGTLTISERGFSVPYTGKLEKLAQISVRKPIMDVLKYDSQCDLDALCHAQFNRTVLRAVGTSSTAFVLTTNGTATATNSIAFNSTHAKSMTDTLKDRNIRPYTGEDYMAIARHSALRTFKNNLEDLYKYTERGITQVFNGEIGRYEQTRYVEQTSVPSGGAANSTTFSAYTNTSDAWDNGLSDWIFFFGADTVAEGVNTPEEIRFKEVTDFNRSKGVAWYYLGGFGLARTTESEATVIKWDSAA
jgi:N4-gp56 family major capsid protein